MLAILPWSTDGHLVLTAMHLFFRYPTVISTHPQLSCDQLLSDSGLDLDSGVTQLFLMPLARTPSEDDSKMQTSISGMGRHPIHLLITDYSTVDRMRWFCTTSWKRGHPDPRLFFLPLGASEYRCAQGCNGLCSEKKGRNLAPKNTSILFSGHIWTVFFFL